MTPVVQSRLAALSPYHDVWANPPIRPAASRKITGAVYLFRHGMLCASHMDYEFHIQPFIAKLRRVQSRFQPFATGPLASLEWYQSWLSPGDVGKISERGSKQNADIGRAFRVRYQHLCTAGSEDHHKMPDGGSRRKQLRVYQIWLRT